MSRNNKILIITLTILLAIFIYLSYDAYSFGQRRHQEFLEGRALWQCNGYILNPDNDLNKRVCFQALDAAHGELICNKDKTSCKVEKLPK